LYHPAFVNGRDRGTTEHRNTEITEILDSLRVLRGMLSVVSVRKAFDYGSTHDDD
jgi:hypothetical protein